MKGLAVSFILMFFALQGFGQNVENVSKIDTGDLKYMHEVEDQMVIMADSMINDTDLTVRTRNAYLMIPMLLEILKRPYSFHYPFDSLQAISIVYPPDSNFRVFTWQLRLPSGRYRHFGALQFNQDDSLKLIPFFDASDFMSNYEDTITGKNNWYGCMYYKIISRMDDSTKYYYMFGFDPNDDFSNKKLIEVMHFDHNNMPIFGAPKFYYCKLDTVYTHNRLILTYKEDATPTLNFYPEKDMIVYDHLVPLNPLSTAGMTFVPDGTYEGFKYDGHRWVHVSKVFHEAINKPNAPPVPKPLDFKKENKEMQKAIKKSKGQ